MKSLPLLVGLSLAFPACALSAPAPDEESEHARQVEPTGEIAQRAVDCSSRVDTGYTKGKAFPITVVTVDGKPVETATANAFYVMQQAAAKAGVSLKVVSGFRTMAEQEYLYGCYLSKSCNNGNLAAKPGYSNHQSGHALDLTTGSGALAWLNAHASKEFGFNATVASENWHWEWWGGGPGGGICGVCQPHCEGAVMVQSDCSEGNCGVFGATCANDDLGLRCVAPGCPATGKKDFCIDDKTIGNCNDGALGTGDCSVFASKCVKDGTGAKCESVLCPKTGESKACIDNARLLTCKDNVPSIGDCSVFGAACTAELGEPRCLAPYGAKHLGTTSDAPADETKAAAYKVCAGDLVTTRFELQNTGYIVWTDVGGLGKAEYGKAVRLGVPEGEANDPFTGGTRWPVKNNTNGKVVWNGPDCADEAGCRRTIFAVTGTAPGKVGIYKTRWKLLDEQRYRFEEPVLEATYRVEDCGPLGEQPPEGEGGAAGASGAAGAGGTTSAGGAAGTPGAAGSNTLERAGAAGETSTTRPRPPQGGTEDNGSCTLGSTSAARTTSGGLGPLLLSALALALAWRRRST